MLTQIEYLHSASLPGAFTSRLTNLDAMLFHESLPLPNQPLNMYELKRENGMTPPFSPSQAPPPKYFSE